MKEVVSTSQYQTNNTRLRVIARQYRPERVRNGLTRVSSGGMWLDSYPAQWDSRCGFYAGRLASGCVGRGAYTAGDLNHPPNFVMLSGKLYGLSAGILYYTSRADARIGTMRADSTRSSSQPSHPTLTASMSFQKATDLGLGYVLIMDTFRKPFCPS